MCGGPTSQPASQESMEPEKRQRRLARIRPGEPVRPSGSLHDRADKSTGPTRDKQWLVATCSSGHWLDERATTSHWPATLPGRIASSGKAGPGLRLLSQALMRNNAGDEILLTQNDQAQQTGQDQTMHKGTADNQALFANQSNRRNARGHILWRNHLGCHSAA